MELSKQQRLAFAWGLDVLFDELDNYLQFGNPQMDYGEEWGEVARERASNMRIFAEWTPFAGDAERWNELAGRYEDSITEVSE